MSPNFDKFKVRYWIANLTKLHNFSCLISISSLCSKFESSSDYSNFESVILKSVEVKSVGVDIHFHRSIMRADDLALSLAASRIKTM